MANADLNLTIPLKLDAFVLNEKLSEPDQNNPDAIVKEAKISPIVQPNYTFLQLEHQLLQHDILDHIDLHNAFPATSNSRLYDLGKGKPRENRMGVYLHWVMPRFYRTGTAATRSAAPGHHQERKAKGIRSTAKEPEKADYSVPAFRSLPNRWLVIRKLDPKADTTEPKNTSIQPVESWVIESDRIQPIDSIPKNKDLQVDVSPYITSNNESVQGIELDRQAEIFIGYKESAQTWKESDNKAIERVDLTAVNSSNQLFLDYQPHCSNVFSTVDSFEYQEGDTIKRLTKAEADYYVLGWHSDEAHSPFGDMDDTVSREQRLKALSMKLNGDRADWGKDVTDWLAFKGAAQSICHGAMYNVIWDRNRRPENIPANKASEHLLSSMPVTVGTTPIDSLLSYIDCHKHAGDETDDQKKLENDLHLLEPLLRAQDEKVDVHRVAIDEVQNWNFARETGGSHWYIQSQEGQKTKKPSEDEIEGLEKLNNAQRILDSAQRQIIQLRWDMFSHWWKFVSGDIDPPTTQTNIQSLQDRVNGLINLVKQQTSLINDKLLKDPKYFLQKPQEGTWPEFCQARDPTILVSGIEAGWPDDYLDDLKVRLDNQLISSDLPDSEVAKYGIKGLPPKLFETARRLVGEFNKLSDTSAVGEKGHYTPLYHDKGKHGTSDLRDRWAKTQPWSPLFLEWQIEYFHIPWDDWSLSEALSPDCKDEIDKRWRLAIDPKVNLLDPQINDRRTLSGRILLLPQPNFSLHTAIVQLLNSVSPEVKKKYNIEELEKNTWKLPFLSAPLDGFTDHLLTMVHGTHIKPNARYPPGYDLEGVHPIKDALLEPFNEDHLSTIDIHSEQTPYGGLLSNSLSVLNEISPSKTPPYPFKPVTHGQFRFSKLNIIDKFGQAISAIDPRYGHEDDQAIYPYLSSYYEPQLYEGKPNLVRQNGESHQGHVEFAQVPPSINQPARLNSAFVVHDKRRKDQESSEYSYWRPATEWENPIWAWVVLNYVDNGVQIFLPDGTFYREIRLANKMAPPDAALSAKWLPFPPPTGAQDTTQVDRLIDKLTKDRDYLHAFLKMANDSQEQSSSSAPSAYAGFLNSLVGRPLALVNAGWSLELSIDEKRNQALSGEQQQPIHLLPENGTQYRFPIKLGDKDRSGDGLIGYFNLNETEPNTDLTPGNELDLKAIYTYYMGGDKSGILKDIKDVNSNKPPKLPCFWLKPDDYIAQSDSASEREARLFARNWNKKLQVFGAIVDPFLPITTFSSILPMNKLQLAPWTWQQAMQKMTAFFHLGPIVVTEDVEKYNTEENKALPVDYKLDPANDPTIKDSAVGMPALQTGNWAWLQPYLKNAESGQEYRALGLGKVDSAPRFESGPYTAIEGYLQLKQPIIRPAIDEDAESK